MRRLAISITTAAAVFAAGAAALIYQVVFARYLARFVGSDHIAAGLTLGLFLAGLALGSALFGRLSVRLERHLGVYAVLELAVGAWALMFPVLSSWLAGAVESWSFARPWMLLVQGLVVAAVLVLPPTLIMGGTVPFLTRALARDSRRVSSLHAALYAANTAGAFAGSLLAGFWLVPRYGLPVTVRGTAVINICIAVWFSILALRSSVPLGLVGLRVQPEPSRRYSAARLYAIGLLSGFAVLLLETSVLRFSALVLGGSAYAFALVVAAFVLTLAAGSLVVSRLSVLPSGLLWRCQVTAGACLLAGYVTLDLLPYGAHLLRIGFQAGAAGFYLFYGAVFAVLVALLALPVGLLGTTLPLVYHELGASIRNSGRLSGNVLAWNGLGALAGAIAGSFALYDLLDLPRGFLLAVAAVFGNALLAARPAGRRPRVVAAAALVITAATAVFLPWYDEERFVAGVYRIRAPLAYSWRGPHTFHAQRAANISVVAHDDDAVASIAVIEHHARPPDGPRSRSLLVNGRSESDTATDATTLRLSAHLPALWAADRRRVLVIGMGTGVTAGMLALYDDMIRLDVAEISPSVVRFLPLFEEFTQQIDRDPRLHVRVGDASLTVRQAAEPWNIVISEPSNPWTAGADTLFTREFYRAVRQRLTDDGLFLQWVQLYESDFQTLGIVLNTVREEFPVVHAFRGSPGDLLLLATQHPFTAEDRQRAERVLEAQPRVAASLAEVGIHSVREILEREVQTLPIVFAQSQRYGVNTADHPRLLYLAGRAMFTGSAVSEEMLRHGITDLEGLME